MPQHEGFLATIGEAPSDDAPRLIYADWLEENGDPQRAEFIRTQVALHANADGRGELPTADIARLARRKRALLRRHKKRWLAPLRELNASTNLYGEFSRGFFDCTSIDLATFLERGGELWQHVPVSDLWFGEIGRLATRLRRCEHLARLRGLSLSGTITQVRTVLGSPHLTGLRSLSLSGKPSFTDEDVADLASLPQLPPLVSLSLSAGRITGVTLPALLRRFDRLESFSLDDGNRFEAARLGEVLAALDPARVRSLNFWGVPLDAAGMRALARSRFPSLTDLWLRDCSLDAETLEELRQATHLTSLAALYLDMNPSLADADGEALAAWPGLRSVKTLNLDDAGIGPGGAEILAGSPHFCSLEELGLRHCDIGDAGCEALAGSAWLPGLRQLDLDSNGLTDAGAAAIARAPFRGIRSLNLDYNAIGDVGAEALAGSPHLRTLRGLTVGDPVSQVGATRLATSLPSLNFLIARGAWWAAQIEAVRQVVAAGGDEAAVAAAVKANESDEDE